MSDTKGHRAAWVSALILAASVSACGGHADDPSSNGATSSAQDDGGSDFTTTPVQLPVLADRDGWDDYPDASAAYVDAWQGPVFVLTRHPEDAQPADGGKNLEVFSPTIGRQLLQWRVAGILVQPGAA